eukprot:TRINITY_DN15777_c0_g1_i1.p1 TRINITY_DN15777_c0_g1~~TRINITY_DN15777_c0_g1_i1.p1  ORF type:complete len:253 (-),score=49.35 TRINITY_DN15777_c0_g1_i1:9-767(-)
MEGLLSVLSSLATEIKSLVQLMQDKNSQEVMKEKDKSRIHLNVGGRRFATTRSTLTSLEGTYFSAMLASETWKPDPNGEYFIDRDPTYFNHILNYLRTGSVFYRNFTEDERNDLETELDYYQIPYEKMMPWKWDSDYRPDSRVKMSINNKRAKTEANDRVVVGDRSVDRFAISLRGKARVGLATKTNFGPNIAISQEFNSVVASVEYNKTNGVVTFSSGDHKYQKLLDDSFSSTELFPCVLLPTPDIVDVIE